MPRRKILPALFALAVPVLAMSCDAEPDSVTATDFPLCAPGSMHIVGSLDDMSIDLTLPGPSGGLSQGDDGGEYQYQADFLSDPTEPDLRLTWPRGVVSGKVSPATGTLRLMEGPFAGQSLCAGAGTTIRIPRDESQGTIQFELLDIRSGESCAVAHTGALRGCTR
jgi:hypothetical protein